MANKNAFKNKFSTLKPVLSPLSQDQNCNNLSETTNKTTRSPINLPGVRTRAKQSQEIIEDTRKMF